jgi:hypothetical protein
LWRSIRNGSQNRPDLDSAGGLFRLQRSGGERDLA